MWNKVPFIIECESEKEARSVRARLYAARRQMLPVYQQQLSAYTLLIFERDGRWFLEAKYGDSTLDRFLEQLPDRPNLLKAPEIPESVIREMMSTEKEEPTIDRSPDDTMRRFGYTDE